MRFPKAMEGDESLATTNITRFLMGKITLVVPDKLSTMKVGVVIYPIEVPIVFVEV